MKHHSYCISIIILACILLAGCELQALITMEEDGEPCLQGNEFGRCMRYEYCTNEGKCAKAGDECENALSNHNGYGYCLSGYACTNGECQLAKFVCRRDSDCEAPLKCNNGVCTCGKRAGICGDNQHCCSDSDDESYCISFDKQSNVESCGVCALGFANCNNDWSDGCEVNVWVNDVNNCGDCGASCAPGEQCINGRCGSNECRNDELMCVRDERVYCLAKSLMPLINLDDCEHCSTGYGDCNQDLRDGCEQNLWYDNENCGACNNVCSIATTCIDGKCTPGCSEGETVCDYSELERVCVDLSATNMSSCGVCKEGFKDCNNSIIDGCEVDFNFHHVSDCQQCVEGYANCDGDWANGCEVDLNTRKMASCNSCVAGWGNCDGDWANGCEVHLMGNDYSNCGACGRNCNDNNACTQGDKCVSGSCVAGTLKTCTNPVCRKNARCNPSTGACISDVVADGTHAGGALANRCCGGASVNISNNTKHCGGCGLACSGSFVCEPASTSGCAPSNVSGRCKCLNANAHCPTGAGGLRQICRLPIYSPLGNRCVPENANACASGQRAAIITGCPYYCSY
ncbi:MAG: hypothetical protein WC966_10440 [Bradymonadales bacterium]